MTIPYFTLLSLLSSLVQGSDGLTCLSCIGIAHPRFCDYVEDCNSEKVCGIESVVHPHGHAVFNVGCFDRKTCIENGTGTQALCRHCCTSNICNMAGCGEKGITQSRGPICYNCKGVLTMDECTTVSVCEQNQACLIEEHYSVGERFYTTSCQYTNVCESLSSGLGLPVIGKRSHSKMYRSSATCNMCCFNDLCNNRCSSQRLTTRSATTVSQETSNAPRTPVTTSSHTLQDCSNLSGNMHKSGVYVIYPGGVQGYKVYCDMDTDGGGWTVFQYRSGGYVNFHDKLWTDCKNGFGNVNSEHWLGNERLHQLTALGNNVLRIYLEDWEGNSRYAMFRNVSVTDESSNYTLSYGAHSANAVADLANKESFTTKDRDNDAYSSNCAIRYGGPWWYKIDCGHSDLNGKYGKSREGLISGQGVIWDSFKGFDYSLKVTKMMIRRI